MKVRAGDTLRFSLPTAARFVPFGAPTLYAHHHLQFTVTPAMLAQVLKPRRRRERQRRQGRA